MYYHHNPYRGPFPFTSKFEDIFFGREVETAELIDLIRKNSLTILFGSSGTGKTSLINARLLPQLKREYFQPIYLRINFVNKNESPIQYVRKRIVEELRILNKEIPDFEPNQTLIDYAAKNVIFKGLIKPVLFFDQFEELFTLGPKNDPKKINDFILELADLIELRLPNELKNSSSIKNISSFKVVFSMRQDWVGFLDDFNHLLPSVLENRYRLKKFSPPQAFNAITCPAKKVMSGEVAEKIIELIGTPALWQETDYKQSQGKKLSIEVDPFVLSLYCYQLYEEASKQDTNAITIDFINKHHNSKLIRHYYDENMKAYESLKIIVENKLLNESGKRLLIPLDKFVDNDLDLKKQIEEVEKQTGIVRITGMEADCSIEIVHDQLAVQIFESKKERESRKLLQEADEKNKEASDLQAFALKNAEEAKQFRNIAQKDKVKLRRVIWLSSIIVLLILVAVVYLYNSANSFKNEANNLKQEALENNKKSIKIYEDSLKNNSVQGLRLITIQKSDSILLLHSLQYNVIKQSESKSILIASLQSKLKIDSEIIVSNRSEMASLQRDNDALRSENNSLKQSLSSANASHPSTSTLLSNDSLTTSERNSYEVTSSNIQVLSDSVLKRSEIRQSGISMQFKAVNVPNNRKINLSVQLIYTDVNNNFKSVFLRSDAIGYFAGTKLYKCVFTNVRASYNDTYLLKIWYNGSVIANSVIEVH